MWHPKSISFYKCHKQVFLCRPGLPILIEIQEGKELEENEFYIEEFMFPFQENRFLDSLYSKQLKMSNEIQIRVNGKIFDLNMGE